MHIVVSTKDVHWGDGQILPAFVQYVVDDCNMALFTHNQEGTGKACPFTLKPIDPATDYNGKKILLIRAGGYGDIVFLTPAVRELKRRWKDCIVAVSCKPNYWQVLENNADVDELYQYPLELKETEKFDAIVSFENLLENQRSKQIGAMEHIEEILNLEILDKKTHYEPTEQELIFTSSILHRNSRKRVGFQVTSVPVRTYPLPLLSQLIVKLASNEIECVLFGNPKQYEFNFPSYIARNVYDMSCKHLSFRESVAMATHCDLFVGQDSGLLHAVAGTGKECIAFYAAYPAEFRVKHQPNVYVLEGKLPCAPCFAPPAGFPKEKPCTNSKQCEALATISPDKVFAEISKRI